MPVKEPGRVESLVALARAYPMRTLLGLLVVGVGLWLLAVRLIPTESGRVRATIEQVRDGLVEGNADKVMANVSPYFLQEGVDKEALDRWLRRALANRPIGRIYLGLRQVHVQGGNADVSLSASSSNRGRVGNTDWLVSLEKVDGRWLVRKAVPTDVNGFPTRGFRALFRIY